MYLNCEEDDFMLKKNCIILMKIAVKQFFKICIHNF